MAYLRIVLEGSEMHRRSVDLCAGQISDLLFYTNPEQQGHSTGGAPARFSGCGEFFVGLYRVRRVHQ